MSLVHRPSTGCQRGSGQDCEASTAVPPRPLPKGPPLCVQDVGRCRPSPSRAACRPMTEVHRYQTPAVPYGQDVGPSSVRCSEVERAASWQERSAHRYGFCRTPEYGHADTYSSVLLKEHAKLHTFNTTPRWISFCC